MSFESIVVFIYYSMIYINIALLVLFVTMLMLFKIIYNKNKK